MPINTPSSSSPTPIRARGPKRTLPPSLQAALRKTGHALPGYALACAAKGEHLDEMATASIALEAMVKARESSSGLGRANIWTDFIRNQGLAYADVNAQHALRRRLDSVLEKKILGKALGAEEAPLADLLSDTLVGYFRDLAKNDPQKAEVERFHLFTNACSRMGKAVRCGEISSRIIELLGEMLPDEHRLQLTQHSRIVHVVPEILPPPGRARDESLELEAWAPEMDRLTPLQRRHASLATRTDSPMASFDTQTAAFLGREADALYDSLKESRAAKGIFEDSLKSYALKARRLKDEIQGMLRVVDGARPEEYKEMWLTPLSALHPESRSAAHHALESLAHATPLQKEVLTHAIDRGMGYSITEAADKDQERFALYLDAGRRVVSQPPHSMPGILGPQDLASLPGELKPAFTKPYSQRADGFVHTRLTPNGSRLQHTLLDGKGRVVAESGLTGMFTDAEGEEYIPILADGSPHDPKYAVVQRAESGKRLVQRVNSPYPPRMISTTGRIEDDISMRWHARNIGALRLQGFDVSGLESSPE